MDPAGPPPLYSRPWLLGLAVVSILGALYLWQYLDRGWVPHDEGTLAQSAERVLQGELPHRDFDDVYTGGLSYLHALAFRVGEIRLPSIRRALFLFFLAWLPVVYFLATRWASIPVAVLVTLWAVTLSVPNYSAAIPSWYNLFLATIGIAALLRFLETRKRRWIFVAGLAGGLSILIKIVGLYYVAAVALTLLAWEQSGLGISGSPEPRPRTAGASPIGNRLYSATVLSGLLAFVAAIYLGLRSDRATPLDRSLRDPGSDPRHPPSRKGAEVGARAGPAALAGSLAPGSAFRRGSPGSPDPLPGLLHDPRRPRGPAARALCRSGSTAAIRGSDLSELGDTLDGHPSDRASGLVLSVEAADSPDRHRHSDRYPSPSCSSGPTSSPVYQPVFYSFRWMVLIAVVAGALILRRRWLRDDPSTVPVRSAAALFALLAGAGLCNLVQFPFAAPIYFFYVAPLGLLALLATLSFHSSGARPLFVLLVAFYMIFCVAWVNRGFIYWMGIHFVPDSQTEVLDIDRGGIRVNEQDKKIYESLTGLIREKARGPYIYATPDSPQVYFLSGYQNPTPTLFDFFDDPEDRVSRTLQTLADKDVNLVVLNHKPDFSDAPPAELLDALRSRFPNGTSIAHFEVRWKP